MKKRMKSKAGASKKKGATKKIAKTKLPKRKATKRPAKKKKVAKKKAAVAAKTPAKRTTAARNASPARKNAKNWTQAADRAFSREKPRARSGQLSGDLQGLESLPDADSESVDELLEEGNVFEADVLKGVEDAGDAAERQVRTHEVPEDDVPEEYLDNE